MPAASKEEKKFEIPPHYFVFEVNPKTSKKKKAMKNLRRTSALISRQEKELEDLEDLTPKEEK